MYMDVHESNHVHTLPKVSLFMPFLVPSPQTSCHESPISKMFGGKLQSTIYRSGMKETVSVEPFFSLPLDIQVGVVW